MRINKFLAKAGLGSRRACEQLVLGSQIKINGKVVTDLATTVDPEKDKISFQNKLLKIPSRKVYLMLNKPQGYIVTASDPFHRKTVFELLPKFHERIFPVGRLDKSSCGLLLFTNDGDFANRIMHPNRKIPKVYLVKAKGKLHPIQLNKLREGVILNDGRTLPAKVFIKNYSKLGNITKLRITIYEGRNHQVRRMIEKIGSKVILLKRVQIGEVRLNRLPEGNWRFLKDKEIRQLNYISG